MPYSSVPWGGATWELNVPPGWPQMPRGWVPTGEWTPDPSLPPVPEGWVWWVLRPRRYVIGLLDRPVLRDWLFWVALFGLAFVRPGVSAGTDTGEWQVLGHPQPGDSLPVEVATWGGLLVGQLLIFLVIPGLIRRHLRQQRMNAAPLR